VNSLADSDCSRNTVNFNAVFAFRALNNTFRITPSFCGASFSLLFLADREIQTAILQMLNTHNRKTVGKGVPSTKPIIDYLSVQLGR